MIIASLTPFKPDPLKKDWGSFKQMRELADFVCVLCDRCHVFDLQQFTGIRIDDVTETRHNLAWEDYTNKLTLLARATAHKADWVMFLDDDEKLIGVDREKLREQIFNAEGHGCTTIHYRKYEMWTETHARVDGIWGSKRKLVLAKNPLTQPATKWGDGHLSRLHALPVLQGPTYDAPNCRLIHYGMCSPELRRNRIAKYRHEDPNNELQSVGYSYMADESNIELLEIKT